MGTNAVKKSKKSLPSKPLTHADPKNVDSAAQLIEKLLSDTKERWLKDSSLSILCCTENRTGTGT